MTAVLLIAHVLAAILLIGPITVAASQFPRYISAAHRQGTASPAIPAATAMHRISVAYTRIALLVPVLGIATAMLLGALGQPWVLVSIAVTAAAGALLALQVIPQQRRALAIVAAPSPSTDFESALRRLRATTGLFGLAWTTVIVLMVIRPGSTTGV